MNNIHKSIYRYHYRRSSDQDAAAIVRRPVVVVGAGPVGLATAIDLALHDVPVVLIDDADRIGEGSRGICWSKRTLEILDRLGIGEHLVAQGVTWKLGKVFRGDELLFSFDLLPEEGHKMPAFINLQQYYLEKALVDRALELHYLELRWNARLTGVDRLNDGVRLTIDTPDGPYRLDADWLIAADGARSTAQRLLGLDFAGVTFEDKFLIADVRMAAEFPTERRFWFMPTFHSGQSALMHRQPDNVWRVDLQLGPDADPVAEQEPERVRARLDKVLAGHAYELEWVSVYTFNCRRLDRFVHDRVIFIGDAAHQVSPFGARGANSGIQDAENLAWKLAVVLAGQGGSTLIESYDIERIQAADENIGHSTRSTDFMSPHSTAERRLRDAVLALAPTAEFARRMVNSGRLSLPAVYDTPLSTPDTAPFAGTAKLGAPLSDAPLARADGSATHLLENLRGDFALVHVKNGGADGPAPRGFNGVALTVIGEDLFDREGKFTQRLDATPGATYLVRPDQHLCARWRSFDAAAVRHAHQRALAR
ncbi:MAG: FAD-dependent oxidoreductase [Xanthobacteraceae bacterium]|jgi:3-(3-hydroxy-phenyl)propionate hydroxylase